MKLVIVESPTKAKTLKRFLGKDFSVEASMGHLRDLPKSKLSVDVEHGFEPEYETVKGRSKTVAKLRKLSKEAEEIFLAMDPDREGEAIAYHVARLLSTSKKAIADGSFANKFGRVTFHEITKEAIIEAMEQPGKIKQPLVEAQQARRVLDRLVGYSLSPVLWKKVRRGLSAGRVQSVALRMIVEREREIEAFGPQVYFVVTASLYPWKRKPEMFGAELVEIADKKVVVKGSKQDKGAKVTYITKGEDAKRITQDLLRAEFVVEAVERVERKRQPYPPYTTSTLQQAAANTMGWSGKQTMRIAQQLYEAGLITYHRTDSTYLSAKAVERARKLIVDEYGAEHLPAKAVFYKTKSKSAQEAHEAIRPTEVSKAEAAGVSGNVTPKHTKLYKLIRQRFIACQMKPAVYDQTTVVIRATAKQEYKLRAAGSVMKFQGWRAVYGRGRAMDGEEKQLPAVEQGEPLECEGVEADKKETQPPPRYNDASLVKELEKRGIGRPSTYAPIISVLDDRGYIERRERRFYPTTVGMTVVEFLTKHFDEVMDYDFTAQMEGDLDLIAEGEKDWRKMMGEFYKPFVKKVEASEKVDRVSIPVEKTGKKCPGEEGKGCPEKGELVIRTGRFGKFLSCSAFPKCKYSQNYTEKLEGFVCPECGSDVVVKRTRRGRSFWGCSTYPKCDWASWTDPRKKEVKKT